MNRNSVFRIGGSALQELTTDDSIALVDRYAVEAWGQGDLGVIDEIFSPNLVRYGLGVERRSTHGANDVKNHVRRYRSAIPDLQLAVSSHWAGGGMVLTKWSVTGTQGEEITAEPLQLSGWWLHLFAGALIVEEWLL